ncbi:MAG TPA: 4-hydroxy-tetrahydrodipicolinate synthase [Candidatus Dormibacteraeota bacterium]|nr:4-hydroxy-tetrahydrodipicolinate synthase [Candidatus Dormibacteraeota bacterium]
MKALGSIVTAMITPFDDRGGVNLDEAKRLARWLVSRGNDGLVIGGSTGEGMTLDAAERIALVSAVKAAVGDSAIVIANAGTNDTRSSVSGAKEAMAAGADALLAVVPYYNKPTQSGMIAHFGAMADAVPLPIVIYNIPGRTAANMLPETLLELARKHRNVVGVKESSGDLKQIATIVRDRAPGFVVWSGDDHLFLPCLALGADGIVGVASHLCSPRYRELFDAFRAGDVARAAQIHAELLALMDGLFLVTNPIAVKWAMRRAGFNVGECRLPLDGMPAGLAERLEPIIAPYVA